MSTSESLSSLLVTIGRIGIASLFILGGMNKTLSYSDTLKQMDEVGLPVSAILLPLVILLELGGGFTVALNRRLALPAVLALASFTLSTNIVFHDFWNMEGELAALELSLFFKNLSIVGALLLLAGLCLERGEA